MHCTNCGSEKPTEARFCKDCGTNDFLSEDDAEACFQKAIAVTLQQNARSLELRTSLSLARLWQHQGRPEPARQLLDWIHCAFTEGLDSADMRDVVATCR